MSSIENANKLEEQLLMVQNSSVEGETTSVILEASHQFQCPRNAGFRSQASTVQSCGFSDTSYCYWNVI